MANIPTKGYGVGRLIPTKGFGGLLAGLIFRPFKKPRVVDKRFEFGLTLPVNKKLIGLFSVSAGVSRSQSFSFRVLGQVSKKVAILANLFAPVSVSLRESFSVRGVPSYDDLIGLLKKL